MKRLLAAALLLSLVANGVLLQRRPPSADDHRSPSSLPATPAIISFEVNPAGAIAEAWKLSAGAGPKQFAARLRAAGVPERLVRALITAAIDEDFRARETALRPPPRKLKFWQADTTPLPFPSRLALLDLQREKSKLLAEILGPDPGAEVEGAYAQLPAAQRELAKTIVEDYGAMLTSLRDQSWRLRLPSEREQIAFLEAQRHRDLAELLSPDQVADFERRNSPIADGLRYQLRFYDASPEEFEAIFAAQSVIIPLNSSNRGGGREVFLTPEAERAEDEEKARQLAALQAALGDARYAEYQRAKERDFLSIGDLAVRAGLPSNTADRAFDLRDQIAADSLRIANDDTLDLDQKRAGLKTLAANSRAQLAALLGPDASTAFSDRSESLFRELESGNYVVFHENGTTIETLSAPPPNSGSGMR